jgi:hypothetical protein
MPGDDDYEDDFDDDYSDDDYYDGYYTTCPTCGGSGTVWIDDDDDEDW